MAWVLIDAAGVIAIHGRVLNPGDLPGLTGDRSPEAALARVENRIAYGMIGDAHDLAAAYAVALARGHVFNDGNKRTAFAVVELALRLNGAAARHDVMAAADWIIAVATGERGEGELAGWLRVEAGRENGGWITHLTLASGIAWPMRRRSWRGRRRCSSAGISRGRMWAYIPARDPASACEERHSPCRRSFATMASGSSSIPTRAIRASRCMCM